MITVESAPVGAFTSLNVAPGVTILGTDVPSDPGIPASSQLISNTPAYPTNPAVAGYNTISGGSEYVNDGGGTITFVFATPIQGFGGYFTGFQPGFFQSAVTFSDGTS